MAITNPGVLTRFADLVKKFGALAQELLPAAMRRGTC
jgi:hypothetical protein